MNYNSVLIFDIETVPDTTFLGSLYSKEEVDACNSDEKKLRELLNKYLKKKNDFEDFVVDRLATLGNASFLGNGEDSEANTKFTPEQEFPRQMFHRVLVISYCFYSYATNIYDIDTNTNNDSLLKDIKIGTIATDNEKDTIEEFIDRFERRANYIEKEDSKPWEQAKPTLQLVGFNSKTFDLPVIALRAAKHFIPCRTFFTNAYIAKYSKHHLDLLDAFSNFGNASRGMKLAELCGMMDIPCKLDGDSGKTVAERFDNGEIELIKNYCETDVVATLLLYLRYLLLSGALSIPLFNKAIGEVKQLLSQCEPHLQNFLSQWNSKK